MSYQPPPPQGYPPPKKKRRLWLIIGIIILALITCGIIGSFLPSTPQPSTGSTSVTATPVPTDTPTTAPKPTIKPTSTASGNAAVTHGTPLLGGLLSDFIGKYGQPNDHTDAHSYHWLRDSGSNADGLIVWNLTHPRQVDAIQVQAVNGDMPNTSAATALCTVYNPADSRQVKRIPLVDANGHNAGFDVVYISASLARVFAPSDFTDSNQNTVTPGTFDIQYLYKLDGTQNIDSCSIQPGQQQTHL